MQNDIDLFEEALRRDLRHVLDPVCGRSSAALASRRARGALGSLPMLRTLAIGAGVAIVLALFAGLAVWGQSLRPTPSTARGHVSKVTATNEASTAGVQVVFVAYSMVRSGPSLASITHSNLVMLQPGGQMSPLPRYPGVVGSAQWSPDGKELLYSSPGQGMNVTNWLWTPATNTTIQLPMSEPASFAQDGTLVYLTGPNGPVVRQTSGAHGGYTPMSSFTLIDFDPATGASASIGSFLMYDGPFYCQAMSSSEYESITFAARTNPEPDVQYDPRAHLAVVREPSCSSMGGLFMIYDTRAHRVVRYLGARQVLLAYAGSPGDLLVVGAGADPRGVAIENPSGSTVLPISFDSLHAGAVQAVTWSPDGNTIYALLRSGELTTVASSAIDGKTVTKIGGGVVSLPQPNLPVLTFTRNGSALVFSAYTVSGRLDSRLFSVRLSDGVMRTLSSNGGQPATFP